MESSEDIPSSPLTDRNERTNILTILDLLRAGKSMSRRELIEATRLGRRVVNQRVDSLIRSGLVGEELPSLSQGGRPASPVVFLPGAGIVLVADISPSVIRTGITDLGGNLIARRDDVVTPSMGPELILDRVERCWSALLESLDKAPPPLMAIGIGVIGPVDTVHHQRSSVVTPFGWDGNLVSERLKAKYGVPVWADNVVNLMALAEYSRHVGEEAADFVLVLVDDGIGGGVISNGRLHRGADGIAGELGHVTVTDDPDVACWCGKTGCLTQVASTSAIERRIGREIFSEPVPGAFDEPEVHAAIGAAGEATGRMLADLVNIFNPAHIVIGGRVAEAGEVFLGPLRTTLKRRAFPASAAHLKIARAGSEDELGLLGAGIMALDGIFSPSFTSQWLRQ